MAEVLTLTLRAVLSYTYTFTDAIGDALERRTVDVGKAVFTDGTGANKLQLMFRDQRTVTSATPNDDIDLAGILTDIYGTVIDFDGIKSVVIANNSTTAADKLQVGGAAANAWTPPFDGSATAKHTIGPGGLFVACNPIDGYAVTAGSNDTLRVAHDGGAADITFDIFLFGTGS